jgi:hypothetical protein
LNDPIYIPSRFDDPESSADDSILPSPSAKIYRSKLLLTMKKQRLDPSRNSDKFIPSSLFYGKEPSLTDLPGSGCFPLVSSKNKTAI